MRQELWKRAVGILTACLMIFTAVPVTALADGEAAGALENIAANCRWEYGYHVDKRWSQVAMYD